MGTAVRDAEILEVNAFVAERKRLRGPPPLWFPSGWKTELQSVWIVEDLQGVARAQLRLVCQRSANPYPTINLVFRNHPIWRVEIEDPPKPHFNPLWAAALGLPPIVTGSHEHSWPDNRDHVATIAPDWEIPARRPLKPQVRRMPQALASFASAINLELDSVQHMFDVPSQSEMFK